MKLVDILARELREWPEDFMHAQLTQSPAGIVQYIINNKLKWASGAAFQLADDWLVAIVDYHDWQAAQCAHDYANKHGCPECGEAESPDWDGVGSPPAGVLIEMKHKNATAEWARPDFCEEELAWVGRDHFITVGEKFGTLSDYLFRPIRTPKQLAAEAREVAIKDLMQLDDIYHDQAAAIYDAGYRKVSP